MNGQTTQYADNQWCDAEHSGDVVEARHFGSADRCPRGPALGRLISDTDQPGHGSCPHKHHPRTPAGDPRPGRRTRHRRTQLGEADWWRRYGPVWAAIRRDVLPKFTPAELRSAGQTKPAEALLELAEDPWEHP